MFYGEEFCRRAAACVCFFFPLFFRCHRQSSCYSSPAAVRFRLIRSLGFFRRVFLKHCTFERQLSSSPLTTLMPIGLLELFLYAIARMAMTSFRDPLRYNTVYKNLFHSILVACCLIFFVRSFVLIFAPQHTGLHSLCYVTRVKQFHPTLAKQ